MKKILLLILLLMASTAQAADLSGILGRGPLVDLSAPTISSATIGTNGITLTLGMSETVTRTGGTFDVDCNTAGNNLTATYSSGSGSNSLVYTLGTTVNSGDTCNLDYDGAAGGIVDAASNSLAAITNGSITNNSTQSAVACQGSNPSDCTYRETFDGSAACGDSTNNTCVYTWTGMAESNPIYATAPAPYQGTYSLNLNSIWTAPLRYTITAADEYYITMIFRTHALSGDGFPIGFRDGSDNPLCRAQTTSDNIVYALSGASTLSGSAISIAADTKYYFKLRAKKGTGSNAECELWVSTNGTSWGASVSVLNGTWTAQPSKITLEARNADIPNIVDDIRVHTGDISY